MHRHSPLHPFSFIANPALLRRQINAIVLLPFLALALVNTTCYGQDIFNNPSSNHGNRFEQLGTILPGPNVYRTASGAPGPKYWQQRADYRIRCTLDEKQLRLTGQETITYYNRSPDDLDFLWLQLDENQHSSVNNANYQYSTGIPPEMQSTQIDRWEEARSDNGFGDHILSVSDDKGKALPYTINKTMMRVDLPHPLKSGQQFILRIGWYYNLANRVVYGGRGGYEFFPQDSNYLFTITQWYPRMCVYSDYRGWHNQQFAGREFALEFGNFDVQMTVPADHVVAGTGQCTNYRQNLPANQWKRWLQAQQSTHPVDIVTLEEARRAEQQRSRTMKTWAFHADSVRDFAWTSSRKYVWDAMAIRVAGKKVMCMSLYPKESYGLYHPYSTRMVAHTIQTYAAHTFPYPYPVAQSVEAANGMEYPMIAFNYGRTDVNGQFTDSMKNAMITVVIHEVGHNFFPMIVNSDERQWSWMDEGLNTFLQTLAEKAWDSTFPSGRGSASRVVSYMRQPLNDLEPIMTDAVNVLQYGANAYTKTACALAILRETVMGRELFDFAFKQYATRWRFKHPVPADFFRTMEDASGEDLDWFWRGWFYSTEHCDIAIDTVKYFRTDSSDRYFYEIRMSNKGGLVMPVIIEWTYADGTRETDRIPAFIWRLDEEHIAKAFMKDKEVVKVELDPFEETADTDRSNNVWTSFGAPARFRLVHSAAAKH